MPEKTSPISFNPAVPDRVSIRPSQSLSGEVLLPGDKVTAVHLLLATAVLDEQTVINNPQYCGDVLRIARWLKESDLAQIDATREKMVVTPKSTSGPVDLTNLADTRSNVCLTTALAIKHGSVIYKGTAGCGFVERKVDRHFELMQAFGLNINQIGDAYKISAGDRHREINFDCSTPQFGPSVGVSIHALIAGLVYPGKINLTNTALEFGPATLSKFLQSATNREIEICGRTVKMGEMNSASHKKTEVALPPDVTTACTYFSALAAAGSGSINLNQISINDLPQSILKAYRSIGIDVQPSGQNSVVAPANETGLKMPADLDCEVWPGFPTDAGPIYAAGITGKSGQTVITDKVYTRRSAHVPGLKEMGYGVEAWDNKVFIKGNLKRKVESVTVNARDIRTGAAMVVGALGADGECITVENYKQVVRGYEDLAGNLNQLGADIKKET